MCLREPIPLQKKVRILPPQPVRQSRRSPAAVSVSALQLASLCVTKRQRDASVSHRARRRFLRRQPQRVLGIAPDVVAGLESLGASACAAFR
jgi:hypothetical protein